MRTGIKRKIKDKYPAWYYRWERCSLWGRKHFVSDARYVEWKFMGRYGFNPDLTHPRTYNEHVTRLLLTEPTPLMIRCADKYAVRGYVEEITGKGLLNKLYGVYDDFDGFADSLNELPDQFVLKATHGSHWNYICRNKQDIDIKRLRVEINHWLKSNFYYYQRELVYRDIVPRLICEKYLEDESGGLIDYKVQCFRGHPKFFHVAVGRYTDMVYNTYDMEGKYLDAAFFKGRTDPRLKINPDLPLDRMYELCGMLSADFDFVRVDFYFVDKRFLFSELTFTPANGFFDLPFEDDLYFGSFFDA